MRIDTLGLEALIAIADQGNFRKAARVLHITQTALSRRLQNLESLLEVTLVERTTRSVALTAVGRDFVPQARRLLGELTAALVELHETGKARRGDVTIACVPTVGVQFLPRIIQAYAARYPENRIKLLDHASSGVAQAVLSREAEFGIHIGGTQHPELIDTALFEDRLVVICRADHALANSRRVSWQQLRAHPVIAIGADSGNRPLVDRALGAGNLKFEAHFEVQRSSTAVGLVAAGVAVAIVPGLALQPGAYPDLRVIALTHPVVSRTLSLVRRRSARLSPAAQALYDLVEREGRGSGC